MGRKWYKMIPPKKTEELVSMYHGIWMPQMDRYWESDDGFNVLSRKIKTAWGVVEHATIQRMGRVGGDIPWAVKQEIKNELFGDRMTAIEVFPSVKKLIDVCDVYHLWILPKDFEMPFGIHPTRDPQCEPVERGYDFDMQAAFDWAHSPERDKLMEGRIEVL